MSEARPFRLLERERLSSPNGDLAAASSGDVLDRLSLWLADVAIEGAFRVTATKARLAREPGPQSRAASTAESPR